MIKKVLNISLYSLITFCVVSFLSLIISMIINKTNNTFPNFSIGFPFKYYNQFLMDKNDFHHGFNRGIIEDFLIIWIIIFIIFSKKTLKQQK